MQGGGVGPCVVDRVIRFGDWRGTEKQFDFYEIVANTLDKRRVHCFKTLF